jgi:Chaperone of endosialidase
MSVNGLLIIIYGQKEYLTQSDALADVKVSPVIPNPIVANQDSFIWTGYVISIKGATNLADTAQALVANCGKYGCEGSGASVTGAVNGDLFGPATSVKGSVPDFSDITGKIVESKNLLFLDGLNTNTPSTYTSAVNLFTGRTNAGLLAANTTQADLSFEYGAGGYKHYLTTTHNGVASSNQNALNFYLNNSATATGSSAPGTGNTLMFQVNQQKAVVGGSDTGNLGYSKLAVVGPAASASGPHMTFNDDGDVYPELQILAWGHNDTYLNFDTFFDGAWKSSIGNTQQSARIHKTNSNLTFDFGTKVAVNTAPTFASLFSFIPNDNSIPTLQINGNTDNQQAGTLFLSQGDAYGYKLWYDATNTLDGLKIVERINNVETTNFLTAQGKTYIGVQDNTVVNNVGLSTLNVVGPAGQLANGPSMSFNDNGDIYPQRQFLNWGHSNIYDCWDCYHDGAAWKNSDANSAFRWSKSATDLVLSSVAAPTVGGNEAMTNRFWINENGDASFANNLYQEGSLVDGAGLQRLLAEEIQGFSPRNAQSWCGWTGAGGAAANPLVPAAGINELNVQDGCWGSPAFLPAVGANGAVFTYVRFSGFGFNIATDRTDQVAQIGVNGGWRATYISNGATWVYQGQSPANNRTLIVSTANPGLGANGQQLTTNGAGALTWTAAASDIRLKKDVRPLEDALSILDKLNPVEFYWNEHGLKFTGQNNKLHRGLIAQEVEESLTGAVNGDIKILNYDEITAVLIRVVKDQEKRIKALESKCNEKEK